MDEVQKAIDKATYKERMLKTDKHVKVFAPSELKSLIKKAVEEAFYAKQRHASITFEKWWEDRNLTFNED